MTKKTDKPFDYEKGMARLETIIEEFDEGGLSLEAMEKSFIEGMELIQKCSERLNQVETRVNKLTEEQQGETWSEEPFDDQE
ncbi:MAG: exodeoxyribonuclease VII small subunit [Candidatus Hinthialibacter antarcticus]|nr:exodeoxyribonuclease VII small subunit [Candidatus Hinthialibacter antarcticus]